MGPYQRTPKSVARAIRYSGLGVRSVGPVGDFLDKRHWCKEPRNLNQDFMECHERDARFESASIHQWVVTAILAALKAFRNFRSAGIHMSSDQLTLVICCISGIIPTYSLSQWPNFKLFGITY